MNDARVAGVTYYDFHNNDNSGELVDQWFINCSAARSDPASWEDSAGAESSTLVASTVQGWRVVGWDDSE